MFVHVGEPGYFLLLSDTLLSSSHTSSSILLRTG